MVDERPGYTTLTAAPPMNAALTSIGGESSGRRFLTDLIVTPSGAQVSSKDHHFTEGGRPLSVTTIGVRGH